MKRQEKLKTILILILILALPWIPYFYGWYDLKEVFNVTVSGLIGGAVAEYLVKNFYAGKFKRF